jgi:membrane protease YdiL (CAAX protease family)
VNSCYAPPTGRWGLWDIGWFVLIVIGTVVASALLLIPVVIVFPEALDGADVNGAAAAGAWLLALSQLLFFIGLATWPLVVGAWKADGWRRAYGFVVSGRAVWVGLVGGLVTLVAMTVLTNITAELLGRDINSAGAEVADTMTGSGAAYVLFLVLIAVGAPFVEEISFRGLVWGAVVKRGWSPWLATILAAVPFALLHVEPLRVVPLLAAGLVLGVVRQFGGLGSAMLAHAVVNVIGVIGIIAT